MNKNSLLKPLKGTLGGCLLAVLLLAFSLPGRTAEQLQGLYDVELKVSSQSRRDRRKATVEGLKTVFVRISGNHSVLEQASIKASYKKAESYLKQFSYVKRQDVESGDEQVIIHMEFEATLIERLLREQGLPMWSSNRPTVLVWLVADGPEGRHFVGAGDERIVAQIQAQAKRRGLAIKMPSLDLEDSVALSPNELWSLSLWSAQRAASRYQADSLLIGRMTELSNGQWIGSWVFNNAGQPSKLDSDAPKLDTFMGEGMDLVADRLAATYAIVPVKMSAQGVLMRLTGINNFADYARAVHYLEQLSAVRYANPMHVEKNEMLVHLIADGQLHQLEQSLALGKRLKKISPLEVLDAAAYPPIQLNYHWPASDKKQ